MSRIEVLSGPERRRRWSAEEKRSIVAEACSSVCAVARRRDVVPGQIIGGGMSFGALPRDFAAVVVAPEPNERSTTGATAVEIELGRDIRVRIAATAPQDSASAIIKTLAAR